MVCLGCVVVCFGLLLIWWLVCGFGLVLVLDFELFCVDLVVGWLG